MPWSVKTLAVTVDDRFRSAHGDILEKCTTPAGEAGGREKPEKKHVPAAQARVVLSHEWQET